MHVHLNSSGAIASGARLCVGRVGLGQSTPKSVPRCESLSCTGQLIRATREIFVSLQLRVFRQIPRQTSHLVKFPLLESYDASSEEGEACPLCHTASRHDAIQREYPRINRQRWKARSRVRLTLRPMDRRAGNCATQGSD